MSSKIERKLAAIMFTDIAGFTALSAKDENKALELLDKQKEILTPIIEEFNGTLHKEVGDGLLFTFQTVTDALKSGIKIQKQTKNIESLNLRIGVHEGEVTFKDGDVLGDDVNVASRIESYAAIGGIAISGKVEQDISSLPEFATKFISQPILKGVKQDVKIYCITSHNLPETDITKVTAKLEKDVKKLWFNQQYIIGAICLLTAAVIGIYSLIPKESQVPSIAIIPIENKGDKDDDFYSYGISSDLISDVARSGDIRVASLKDIEKLDYMNLNNKELSEELLVRYIAQGTLWKVDDVFQLSIEVYDTVNEKIVWAERWKKEWEELPLIKNNLQNGILNLFNIKIQNLNNAAINAEAYEFYLRAQQADLDSYYSDNKDLSFNLLEKAIELDSNLVEARILLGNIHYVLLRRKISGWSDGNVDFTKEEEKYFNQVTDIFNSAFKIAKEQNNLQMMGVAKRWIGNTYSMIKDYEKTMIYWNEALEIAIEVNDRLCQIRCLGNMFGHRLRMHEYKEAEKLINQTIKINQTLNDIDETIGAYIAIARLYNEWGSYLFTKEKDNLTSFDYWNKAIEYLENALELNKKTDDLRTRISILTRSSRYYADLEDFNKAIEINEEAFNLAKDSKNDLGEFALHMVFFNKIRYSMKKGNFDDALKYAEKTLEYHIKNNSTVGQIYSLLEMGVLSYHAKNYDKAIEYIKQSFQLSTEREFDSPYYNFTRDIYTSLISKKRGEVINNKKILEIANKYVEDLGELRNTKYDIEYLPYEALYDLYVLTDDKNYLKMSYNKIDEEAEVLSKSSKPELKNEYLNRYFQKMIIDEYNKIFK